MTTQYQLSPICAEFLFSCHLVIGCETNDKGLTTSSIESRQIKTFSWNIFFTAHSTSFTSHHKFIYWHPIRMAKRHSRTPEKLLGCRKLIRLGLEQLTSINGGFEGFRDEFDVINEGTVINKSWSGKLHVNCQCQLSESHFLKIIFEGTPLVISSSASELEKNRLPWTSWLVTFPPSSCGVKR